MQSLFNTILKSWVAGFWSTLPANIISFSTPSPNSDFSQPWAFTNCPLRNPSTVCLSGGHQNASEESAQAPCQLSTLRGVLKFVYYIHYPWSDQFFCLFILTVSSSRDPSLDFSIFFITVIPPPPSPHPRS